MMNSSVDMMSLNIYQSCDLVKLF